MTWASKIFKSDFYWCHVLYHVGGGSPMTESFGIPWNGSLLVLFLNEIFGDPDRCKLFLNILQRRKINDSILPNDPVRPNSAHVGTGLSQTLEPQILWCIIISPYSTWSFEVFSGIYPDFLTQFKTTSTIPLRRVECWAGCRSPPRRVAAGVWKKGTPKKKPQFPTKDHFPMVIWGYRVPLDVQLFVILQKWDVLMLNWPKATYLRPSTAAPAGEALPKSCRFSFRAAGCVFSAPQRYQDISRPIKTYQD